MVTIWFFAEPCWGCGQRDADCQRVRSFSDGRVVAFGPCAVCGMRTSFRTERRAA